MSMEPSAFERDDWKPQCPVSGADDSHVELSTSDTPSADDEDDDVDVLAGDSWPEPRRRGRSRERTARGLRSETPSTGGVAPPSSPTPGSYPVPGVPSPASALPGAPHMAHSRLPSTTPRASPSRGHVSAPVTGLSVSLAPVAMRPLAYPGAAVVTAAVPPGTMPVQVTGLPGGQRTQSAAPLLARVVSPGPVHQVAQRSPGISLVGPLATRGPGSEVDVQDDDDLDTEPGADKQPFDRLDVRRLGGAATATAQTLASLNLRPPGQWSKLRRSQVTRRLGGKARYEDYLLVDLLGQPWDADRTTWADAFGPVQVYGPTESKDPRMPKHCLVLLWLPREAVVVRLVPRAGPSALNPDLLWRPSCEQYSSTLSLLRSQGDAPLRALGPESSFGFAPFCGQFVQSGTTNPQVLDHKDTDTLRRVTDLLRPRYPMLLIREAPATSSRASGSVFWILLLLAVLLVLLLVREDPCLLPGTSPCS